MKRQEQRNATHRSKLEAAVAAAHDFTTVKLECERAFTALRQGNQAEALTLMKDLAIEYEDTPHSAMILRAYGALCVKVALTIDDPGAKQRHLKNALDYAKRAAGMSPNSIEYAYFYADLLFDSANEAEVYEEVVRECERALSIENPVGPGGENSRPDHHVQSKLRQLIQKSNVAIISCWMNGVESRVFSGRRAVVDPIELRIVQANGVKKVVDKKPEARRVEVEARVSAAPLMQRAENSPNEMRKVDKKSEEWKKEIEGQVGSPRLLQEAGNSESEMRNIAKKIEEQLKPEASQQRNVAKKSKDQNKEIEEQLMPEASQEKSIVKKSEEQKKGIKEQLMMPEASQQTNIVKKSEEQKKGIKEQLMMPKASQQTNIVKKSEEQKKRIKEQLMMPEASQQTNIVKKSEEQEKGIKEQLMMPKASQQTNIVKKSEEQKKGTKEQLMMPEASRQTNIVKKSVQQMKGIEEKLMVPEASQHGNDGVKKVDKKAEVRRKEIEAKAAAARVLQLMSEDSQQSAVMKSVEIEEQLMPEASQQRNVVKKSVEQKKAIGEQLMPKASQQRNIVKKSVGQNKENEEQLMPKVDKKAEARRKEIEARVAAARRAENTLDKIKIVVKKTEEQKTETEEQLMPKASRQGNDGVHKVDKKLEARRKEIEGRVSLARLLQRDDMRSAVKVSEDRKKRIEAKVGPGSLLQEAENTLNETRNMKKKIEEQKKKCEKLLMAEASQQRNDGVNNNASTIKNPVKGVVGRRKSGKATKAASPDVPNWVTSYWDSLSSEGKKDLLTIKVSDLKQHFNSSKDRALSELLEEAICFEESFNNSWKFWSCCRCNNKHGTPDLFIDHIAEKHWLSMWPENVMILPESAEIEWTDFLRNSSWEPVDLNAATEMLEKLSKSDGSSPRKKSGDDISLFYWPLSNDPERTELLQKIHSLFKKLLDQRCLPSNLVSKVIRFAVDELKGLACGSIAEHEVNQTPLCIRFLGAPELKRIRKFLEKVSETLELDVFSGEDNMGDYSNSEVQGVEIVEKIRLEEDGSFLVIDEQSLPCKIDDVSTALNASHVVFENGVILDSDALLSWIYTGASSSLSSQLASWKRAMVPSLQSVEIFQVLEKEAGNLLSLIRIKGKQTIYEEALMAVKDLCLEEGKKKERQDLEKFLEKRYEGLDERTPEFNAIEDVLWRADCIKRGQLSFEEAYGGIVSHPNDWREKEHLHEADSYVEAAIQTQRDDITIEKCQPDVAMMKIAAAMNGLQQILADESCHDFGPILLSLVKSFLKAQVEDLAKIEATKKSDAVVKELFAEFEQDS